MNYFDIITAIILVIALVLGFKNGLIIELASVLALVLGLLGAIKFSAFVATFLGQYMNTQYIGLIAFVLTFVLIVIGIYLLAKAIDQMVSALTFSFLNRLFGALFSLLKYAFIISVLLAVFESFDRKAHLITQEQKDSSLFYKPLVSIAPFVFPYLNFDDIKEKVEDVSSHEEVII